MSHILWIAGLVGSTLILWYVATKLQDSPDAASSKQNERFLAMLATIRSLVYRGRER